MLTRLGVFITMKSHNTLLLKNSKYQLLVTYCSSGFGRVERERYRDHIHRQANMHQLIYLFFFFTTAKICGTVVLQMSVSEP